MSQGSGYKLGRFYLMPVAWLLSRGQQLHTISLLVGTAQEHIKSRTLEVINLSLSIYLLVMTPI